MKKIAVLVNSCDDFEETWKPFFALMRFYWPECDFPVYLNTETKHTDEKNVTVLNWNVKMSWSERLIKSLKAINSEYVILILDDFFINEKVDHKRILACIKAMDKDKKIAVFSFAPSKWIDIDDGKYEGFELRPVEGEYRFNMQAALWRTKDLLRILSKNETPWETENLGNFRARVLMHNKKFYAAKKFGPRVISYEYGGAIHRGMWTSGTPELLRKHGINNIDFYKRGFDPRPTSDWEKYELDLPFAENRKRSIKIKIFEYLYAVGVLKLKKNK